MLVTGVEQLQVMTDKHQYREVANLLEAVNQLVVGFKGYMHIKRVKELSEYVKAIKEQV